MAVGSPAKSINDCKRTANQVYASQSRMLLVLSYQKLEHQTHRVAEAQRERKGSPIIMVAA
jgi:hypothetical protein